MSIKSCAEDSSSWFCNIVPIYVPTPVPTPVPVDPGTGVGTGTPFGPQGGHGNHMESPLLLALANEIKQMPSGPTLDQLSEVVIQMQKEGFHQQVLVATQQNANLVPITQAPFLVNNFQIRAASQKFLGDEAGAINSLKLAKSLEEAVPLIP